MSFRHQFDDSNVILDLESSTKEDALGEMVDHLVHSRRLTRKQAPAILQAILEREGQDRKSVV